MNPALALAAEHDAAGRHDEAINELAKATQGGDIEATTELGKRLIVGDRAPHLPHDGARFLLDAVVGGGVEAALRVATLAALGAYVEHDWAHALGLLAFAAERGSESARAQLRVLARSAGEAEPADWRALAEQIDLRTWLMPSRGTTMCGDPVIRHYPEFVDGGICDYLIERARGNLSRALIYDPAYGRDIADHMRTNSAAGYDLMSADVAQIVVQYRIAAAIGLPINNLEGPTILHYKVGEQITNHFDFVNPKIPNYQEEIARRGERIITFLIYLNDDYEGGETDFPKVGVRHRGRRRDGLLFTNALPSGPPDLRMVHAGMPPTAGEKWIFSQFIRNRAVLNSRAERVGSTAAASQRSRPAPQKKTAGRGRPPSVSNASRRSEAHLQTDVSATSEHVVVVRARVSRRSVARTAAVDRRLLVEQVVHAHAQLHAIVDREAREQVEHLVRVDAQHVRVRVPRRTLVLDARQVPPRADPRWPCRPRSCSRRCWSACSRTGRRRCSWRCRTCPCNGPLARPARPECRTCRGT